LGAFAGLVAGKIEGKLMNLAQQNTVVIVGVCIAGIVFFAASKWKDQPPPPPPRLILLQPPGGSGMVYRCSDALETHDSRDICEPDKSCARWVQNNWNAIACVNDKASIAQAQIDYDAREAADHKIAAKQEACREDFRCWGDKASVEVKHECIDQIEARAKYQFKWDNSWLDPKIHPQMWSDKTAGVVIFAGNAVLMQNGFGAWGRQRYFCTIDIGLQSLLSAEVLPN
jgi:hypothetical protein